MTVLVDMDDVIECLLSAWVEHLNKKYGTNVLFEEVTDWDIAKAFPDLTYMQILEGPSSDEFWENVKPMPGAAQGLQTLINEGFEVFIVTATWYGSLAEKMDKVLFRYFPFINWNQVIVTAKKQIIKGDVLIDDGPHNLVGGDYEKILFDAPHNRNFDEKSIGAVRVRNWDEVVAQVRKIKAGKGAS